MPDFSELFMKTKGKPTDYNGQMVYMSHQFPVNKRDVLLARIERTNSDCRQGFSIDVTGFCEMDGQTYKKDKGIRMLFWQDTAPSEIKLKVFTDKGFVRIENIWEKVSFYLMATPSGEPVQKETKSVESWYYGAAMIVDEIENGFRYRCNDWHPDENFDDIVFTVQKIKE